MVQTMMRPHRRMKYTCTHILFALSLFDLSFGERSSWPKNTMFTFGGSFSPSLLPSVSVRPSVRVMSASRRWMSFALLSVAVPSVALPPFCTAVSCDAFLCAAVRCAAAPTTNGSEGHCGGEDVIKERAEHREEGHAVIYVEVGGVDEREGEHHEQDKAGQYEQHQLRHGVIYGGPLGPCSLQNCTLPNPTLHTSKFHISHFKMSFCKWEKIQSPHGPP